MTTAQIPIEPFPPGDLIREELEAREWTQSDFAEILGKSEAFVSEIVTGKRGITTETAKALADAFGTSAQWWLNLESSYRLALARDSDQAVSRRAKIYSKAPVREMIKRGWIEPSSNPDVLEQHVLNFLGINSLDETPESVSHGARKSASYEELTSAQMAWLIRARQIAPAIHAAPYSPKNFKQLIPQLQSLMRAEEEVQRVPAVLAAAGVRLLLLEPLPGTKIDGACLWLDRRSPVVAVSLRYDRIDAFWFTLMHELAHVHEKHGLKAPSPVDIRLVGKDRMREKPEVELRADSMAAEALVSPAVLDDFIARSSPIFSEAKIRGFANVAGVHPGIALGQLQYREEVHWSQYRKLLVKVRDLLVGSTLTDGWGYKLPINSEG